MKTLATLAVVAAFVVPAVASACSMHEEHVTSISCAQGHTYDEQTRTCVPQTS
jgi:hypothetical protein